MMCWQHSLMVIHCEGDCLVLEGNAVQYGKAFVSPAGDGSFILLHAQQEPNPAVTPCTRYNVEYQVERLGHGVIV